MASAERKIVSALQNDEVPHFGCRQRRQELMDEEYWEFEEEVFFVSVQAQTLLQPILLPLRKIFSYRPVARKRPLRFSSL